MITPHQALLLTTSSLFILSLDNLFESCDAKCTPSACGIIPNISSPFRLKGDPNNCGDRSFELSCENNMAFISLNSQNYYVTAINYQNSTIRLVDASLNNDDMCSFPIVSLDDSNLSDYHPLPLSLHLPLPYLIPRYMGDDIPNPINFVSCTHPLKNSSLFTDITSHCASNSSLPIYAYIKVGHLNASEVPHLCTVDLIVMTSWPEFEDLNNVSLSEIHRSLLYGFELEFCTSCMMGKKAR